MGFRELFACWRWIRGLTPAQLPHNVTQRARDEILAELALRTHMENRNASGAPIIRRWRFDYLMVGANALEHF